MISYQDVREVHLELSSNCNASCPRCPRNFYGYPHNSGYPVTDLSLSDIEKIFKPDFIAQLRRILVNGNLGDFMLARDAVEIIEYLRSHNKKMEILISTNGSARKPEFWERLAKSNVVIRFCLDGLEGVHELYRVNTQYQTIIRNAQSFIKAGGRAVWKMIKFDHNVHQIDQAKAVSESLGFEKFMLVAGDRDTGPVFDKDGNLTHMIGSSPAPEGTVIEFMYHRRGSLERKRESLYQNPIKPNLRCHTKVVRTIYIASNGDVFPCCFLGHYPKTFDPNLMFGNDQIKELLGDFNNNAIERPLEECISWFSRVEESWKKETFQEGRLWRCNFHCGTN